MDPRVILIVAVMASGYYGGKEVVKGVKKVDHAVVHVIKKTFHRSKP